MSRRLRATNNPTPQYLRNGKLRILPNAAHEHHHETRLQMSERRPLQHVRTKSRTAAPGVETKASAPDTYECLGIGRMVQQPPHHAQTYAASDDGRTDFETQRQAFGQTDHIETDDGEAYVVAVERQDVEADSPAYKVSHSTAHACANVGANSSTKSSGKLQFSCLHFHTFHCVIYMCTLISWTWKLTLPPTKFPTPLVREKS